MKVEVDQSNKVEETEKDTILGLSNNIEYSICIPSAVKKHLLRLLRQRNLSDKIIHLKIFSAGLFILLEPYLGDLKHVVVDIEYQGREADIKAILIRLFQKKYKSGLKFDLSFHLIGKKSFAHGVVYNVGRNRKPNKIVKLKELLYLLQ